MPDSSAIESVAADGMFVGIDWGNSHHQLCVVDGAGHVVDQGKVAHDVAGVRDLQTRLARRGPIVGVAIERCEGLLVEALQAGGHRLFCVSPKMSARDRERMVWNQRDVENQLRAIVQVYHPGVLHLFSSLTGASRWRSCGITPHQCNAGRISSARMAAFCARHGYSGRTRPELLVERLRTHLLSASPGTTAGKAFSAALFVDQLELLNTQVRAITKRIRERLAEHPDAAISLSFPASAR